LFSTVNTSAYTNMSPKRKKLYNIIKMLSSSQTLNFKEFALYTKVQPIHFGRTQLLIVKGTPGTS